MTAVLRAWGKGDEAALERLTPLVYAELRRLAQRYMAGERAGHTLQPTALVNEAFIRLMNWRDVSWRNRAQFFAVSATLMRRILVDFARARRCQKRNHGADMLPVDDNICGPPARETDVVALDDALRSLETFDPRKSRIVELRYFTGLNVEDTAAVLDISSRTVAREWALARAWLRAELQR